MPQHFSVASNSPANRVEAALRITHLTRFFGNRITTFEHVARGKPEPDVFIEAARRAGYAPGDCIVIEDSVTGVTAAHRAGCLVLGFTGTHPHPDEQARKLLAAGARDVFSGMRMLPGLVAEKIL
jgi:beta-phosphoglucomutase-like phosphatase (HAD superfamily)